MAIRYHCLAGSIHPWQSAAAADYGVVAYEIIGLKISQIQTGSFVFIIMMTTIMMLPMMMTTMGKNDADVIRNKKRKKNIKFGRADL